MSDGSYVGGHCLICDEYTKSSSFGVKGLCSSCYRIFGVQNQHELFKTIGKFQKKLKDQGIDQKNPILPKYFHKEYEDLPYKSAQYHAFRTLLNDLIERMIVRFKEKLTEENFSGWDNIYSEEFRSDLLTRINKKIENYDSNPDKHLIDCLNLIAMLWNFETESKGENQ